MTHVDNVLGFSKMHMQQASRIFLPMLHNLRHKTSLVSAEFCFIAGRRSLLHDLCDVTIIIASQTRTYYMHATSLTRLFLRDFRSVKSPGGNKCTIAVQLPHSTGALLLRDAFL